MKLKPKVVVHTKPDLPEEKKEEIRQALLNVISGYVQAAEGPMKAEFVKDFLALFPDAAEALEKEVQRLFEIKKFPKFRTEMIYLMFNLFVGGMLSESDDELIAFFKKHNIRLPEEAQ